MDRSFAFKVMGLVSFLAVFSWCGCAAPVVVGAGATGTYKSVGDTRSLGQQMDDVVITGAVKKRLIAEPGIGSLGIDVDTVGRIVTLTGFVPDGGQARKIEAVVKGVQGVRGVVNRLQTGSPSAGQRVDDKVIGMKIKAGLVKAPGIHSLNVDVDVNGGIVTLTGRLGSAEEKRKVLSIAQNVPGVLELYDNLQVVGK